jgi:hypothetical protein
MGHNQVRFPVAFAAVRRCSSGVENEWRQQDASGTFSGWAEGLGYRNSSEIDGTVGRVHSEFHGRIGATDVDWYAGQLAEVGLTPAGNSAG